jgi:hypothetical protein
VYTGPIADRLGGVDIGWLVSVTVAALTYLVLSQRFEQRRESHAVAASERELGIREHRLQVGD